MARPAWNGPGALLPERVREKEAIDICGRSCAVYNYLGEQAEG